MIRGCARVLCELVVTFGLVILLLVGYQEWGRAGVINAHQSDLDRQLAQVWDDDAAEAAPAEGASVGRLYIPKLDLQWVVVQGVAPDDIRYAPGHYPDSALPGGIGNFAVAGHREEGIFWDLDEVRPGDFLIVESRTSWYVYRVFENHIVTPTSVEVIAPTPNEPGVPPSAADITLTTCNPKWDNYQRMAVHGTLVSSTPHEDPPPQLDG